MSLDGLRAWIGEVERKLRMRTRVFLALAVIAIGGTGAAIYLAIDTRDNAVSEGDVQALQEKLEARIGTGAAGGAGGVAQLEAELRALQGEVAQLRGRGRGSSGGGSSGGSGKGGSSGGGGAAAGGGGSADRGASSGSAGGARLEKLLQKPRKKRKKREASSEGSCVIARSPRNRPPPPLDSPQSTSRSARALPEAAAKGDPMPEGYCVKERKKVEIKDAKQVTMKNGRPAIQGVCPDCGTKIFKIGKM